MRTEADREGSSCWKGMDAPPFQTLQHLCRSSEFVEEVRNLVSILKSLLYKIVIDQLSHTLLGPRSGEGQPGYTLAQLVSEVELCPVFENQEIGGQSVPWERQGSTIAEYGHLNSAWPACPLSPGPQGGPKALSLFSTFGFLSCMPLTWWVE